MAKSKALAFDRMCLEAALREHPGDSRAAASLVDWLMEFETTPFGARRIVVTIIREEMERREIQAANKLVSGEGTHARYLRWRIMYRIGHSSRSTWPVVVVAGGTPPRIRAKRFPDDEIHDLVFDPAAWTGAELGWTYSVEVGCKWLFAEKEYREEIAARPR